MGVKAGVQHLDQDIKSIDFRVFIAIYVKVYVQFLTKISTFLWKCDICSIS